ncbi:protein kinase [Candidatus Dojkabacteria bacterium]|nr:protein kinase [Candidatus Dojkabacteria bacterium]
MIITIGNSIFDGDKNEYKIVETLGQGGFGTVYKVEDNNKKVFALKTLPQSYTSEDTFRGLQNEAQNALTIDSENVVKHIYFHDGNVYDDLPPYIIMDYANGGTLREYMASDTQEFNEQLTVIRQLVSGIRAINEKLVHRDIKPENILFHDGVVKISDFGLSKLVEESTRSKSFKGYGTPLYMSPEGWKNQENTSSMDIYSMGIIFYELLTGKYPFEYDPTNSDSIKEAHLYTNIEPPNQVNTEIPLYLSQIIIKMCNDKSLLN